jgi:hypothetical protein
MREHGFIETHNDLHYFVAENIEDVLPMVQAAVTRMAARGEHIRFVDPRL